MPKQNVKEPVKVWPGVDLEREKPCEFRRGYTQGDEDCFNCRYNRMAEDGKEQCIAMNFIKKLAMLDAYAEEIRNRDNNLVVKGQQSDRLDWYDRNKNLLPNKSKRKIKLRKFKNED